MCQNYRFENSFQQIISKNGYAFQHFDLSIPHIPRNANAIFQKQFHIFLCVLKYFGDSWEVYGSIF